MASRVRCSAAGGLATSRAILPREGPTLADRIAKGALPLDEALHIAKQIAEALESNPWDVHSIETVVAGGDGLQEVVGDKAAALK